MLLLSSSRQAREFVLTIAPSMQGPSPGPYRVQFIVDVSGSMSTPATIQKEAGATHEEFGWSMLNVAQHSINVFLHTAPDNTEVSIVKFSDTAEVTLDWTAVRDGKVREAVDSLKPYRSTNLQAAIKTGIRPPPSSGGRHDVILLTDGCPTDSSPGVEGFARMTAVAREAVFRAVGTRTVLTSIGIGQHLRSDILDTMSDVFLHMNDAGAVGPIMCNLAASIFSTGTAKRKSDNAPVPLTWPTLRLFGASAAHAPRKLQAHGVDGTVSVSIGTIAAGSSRSVVIIANEGAEAVATATLCCGGDVIGTVRLGEARSLASEEANGSVVLRSATAGAISDALHSPDGCDGALLNVIERMAPSPLRAVLAGEVMLATKKRFTWGESYLRTLSCMLWMERRSNFRDEVLQQFGCDGAFQEHCNAAEGSFHLVKPPTVAYFAPSHVQAPAPPPDELMRGGGCWSADSRLRVVMRCGMVVSKESCHIRPHDKVVTRRGHSEVECVALTRLTGAGMPCVRLPHGGPVLTRYHPVLVSETGEFVHAKDVPNATDEVVEPSSRFLYDVVVANRAPVSVDGVWCATLGHGEVGDVIEHSYWGDAVIDAMRASPGWSSGYVLMESMEQQQTDSETGATGAA